MSRTPLQFQKTQFTCQHCLLEFSNAWRFTVMAMHWMQLVFQGELSNLSLIACDNLAEELIAVTVVPLQNSKCCSHVFVLVFGCEGLQHSPGTQFLGQQVLRGNFVQEASGYLQKMPMKFDNGTVWYPRMHCHTHFMSSSLMRDGRPLCLSS